MYEIERYRIYGKGIEGYGEEVHGGDIPQI